MNPHTNLLPTLEVSVLALTLVFLVSCAFPVVGNAALVTANAGERFFGISTNGRCPAGSPANDCTAINPAGNGIGMGFAQTSASPGQIKSIVDLTVRHNSPFQRIGSISRVGGWTSSRIVMDDVVFSGTGDSVFTQPNISADGVTTENLGPNAFSQVSGNFRVAISGPGVNRTWFRDDFFNGSVLNAFWDIGAMEFQTNTAYTIDMSLQLTAEIFDTLGPDEIGPAPPLPSFLKMDYARTLGFRSGDSAFNLPTGFTVNSASANIINNVFMPGTPGAVDVSEPPVVGMLWLLGIAMFVGNRLTNREQRRRI